MLLRFKKKKKKKKKGSVVSTNSSVEIAENEHRLLWRHIADDRGELIVEPVLCLWRFLLTGRSM